MRILVYGAGVLGSQYAARLHAAGHDVSILARGQRLVDLREHGIVLEAINLERRTVARVNVVSSLEPGDAYDLVIVLMRKNQVRAILPVLAANRRTPDVLFLGNNVAGADECVAALGRERVLLGFGGASGVREGHVVRYIAAEEADIGRASGDQGWTMVGELDGSVTPRVERIAEAFEGTGLPVTVCEDVDAWLKTHAALILPLAYGIYAAGGDNYRLARTRDGLVLMVRAVREGFHALRALGVPITPRKYRLFAGLPEPLLVAMLRRALDTQFAEIGLAGHANAARDEMGALGQEFRALIARAPVPTLALDRLQAYVDPAEAPFPPGSADLALDWRGVLVGLGALAGAALAAWAVVRAVRSDREPPGDR
jgi:2-dehydropantoate 2-reductase